MFGGNVWKLYALSRKLKVSFLFTVLEPPSPKFQSWGGYVGTDFIFRWATYHTNIEIWGRAYLEKLTLRFRGSWKNPVGDAPLQEGGSTWTLTLLVTGSVSLSPEVSPVSRKDPRNPGPKSTHPRSNYPIPNQPSTPDMHRARPSPFGAPCPNPPMPQPPVFNAARHRTGRTAQLAHPRSAWARGCWISSARHNSPYSCGALVKRRMAKYASNAKSYPKYIPYRTQI